MKSVKYLYFYKKNGEEKKIEKAIDMAVGNCSYNGFSMILVRKNYLFIIIKFEI
jgi:hypothetical protein